jgi:hypothetical protein
LTNNTGSAVAGVPLNIYGLLGLCGSVATSTTALAPVAYSVKINWIEMWGPQSAYGTDNTVSVEWDAGYVNTNNRIQMGTTVSNAQPAYLKARPPGQSLAGFWVSFGGGNAVLCKIAGPANFIMDVNLSFISSNDEQSTPPSLIITGPATVGNVYYLAPDYPTSTDFPPVGLVTIH